MTTPCDQHGVLLQRMTDGDKKMDEMGSDIKEIKRAVVGDFTRPGLVARIEMLEAVNRNVNKLAWAIGIPVLLAAIFGVWKLITGLIGLKVT